MNSINWNKQVHKEDILIKTLRKESVLQKKIKEIQLLGSDEKVTWCQKEDGLLIKNNFKNLPNQTAICFKIILE